MILQVENIEQLLFVCLNNFGQSELFYCLELHIFQPGKIIQSIFLNYHILIKSFSILVGRCFTWQFHVQHLRLYFYIDGFQTHLVGYCKKVE